ncbi:MAG: double zinc ribbon domain-containing protein [Pseudomonadota bacterium]
MQALIEAVYPPHCLACSEVVASAGGLCTSCWSEAIFLAGPVCDSCGVPILAPHHIEGQATCDTAALRCDDCQTIARPWRRGRSAMAYAGTGRRLALALKNADRTDLPRAAAAWMLRAGAPILAPDMLVAPVPLHWLRLFKRRYNQAALLSQAIAKQAGFDHCPDLLRRLRATPSQDGRSQAERFANLANAIDVHPRHTDMIAGRTVLLVDDVMTTGATLAACAEACLAAGAQEVRILALARVVKDSYIGRKSDQE